MNEKREIFLGISNFLAHINPITMIFKEESMELEYKKDKYEKKNEFVILGFSIFFNLLLLSLRSIYTYVVNEMEMRVIKVGNAITLSYALCSGLPIILELIIYSCDKLRILRGFAINSLTFVGLIIHSINYCNNEYHTITPMFVCAAITFQPNSFLVALVYSSNWICGLLQVFISDIIIEIGIGLMPGSWILDKPWFIIMMISSTISKSITLYVFEFFQRKSIFMKMAFETQKHNIQEVLEEIPEPIIISTEGKIQYVNKACKIIEIVKPAKNPRDPEEDINKTEMAFPEPKDNGIFSAQICSKLSQIINIETKENLYNIVKSTFELAEKHFHITDVGETIKHYEISSFPIKFSINKSLVYFLKDVTNFDKIKDLLSKEKIQRLYIASITHDFRTPLGIILGNAEIINDFLRDDHQKYHINNIINAASILSLLVQDILDYNQLKAENFQIHSTQFNIHRELNNVVNLFLDKFHDKGLFLKLEFVSEMPPVICNDINRIKQIMMNFISNAYKFTLNGGVRIIVDNLEEENKISISVNDTGVGLDQSDMEKLFSEYCRIEKHHEINPMGVGLGLHICKKLVERLGGTITVKSKLNEGTSFTFTFKTHFTSFQPNTNRINDIQENPNNFIVEIINPNYPIEEIKEPEYFVSPSQRILKDKLHFVKNCKCKSVLLVDDDPSIRIILRSYSHKCSLEYEEAENGSKAIEKVKNKMKDECCKWYEFIFIDFEMPFVNGLKASEIIKEDLKSLPDNNTKIVLVTGLNCSDSLNLSRIQKNIFFAIETKPLLFQKFKEIVSCT